MLENIRPDEVLFLDIETVPQQPSFQDLDDAYQHLWEKKSVYFRKNEETASDVYGRAGIYAEFGKIICISTGIIYFKNGLKYFRAKSFCGDNERELLIDFCNMLNTLCSKKNILLCAHNGKEFDFPYIARRVLVNGIALPKILDVAGKKPWEVSFLDTMELWKFGDFKSYTSLELLTKIFGIPTPKDDIDGSQVGYVYWKENNLARIVTYCEKDVLAVAQLFLRFLGDEIIINENIESVTGIIA